MKLKTKLLINCIALIIDSISIGTLFASPKTPIIIGLLCGIVVLWIMVFICILILLLMISDEHE